MVTIPRILIAGTHSGVGKTTVALSLMAAFKRQGRVVQPFKVGPDYIDPSLHRLASGRSSRNLDTWLLEAEMVRAVYHRATRDANLSVIEGVMGVFDGASSTDDDGSTAQVAKLLRAPVVLVVDAERMARSVAALVQGYTRFDAALHVAGVILNRVSGPGHFRLLKESLERYTDVPVLGFLPREAAIQLPERHLGLVPAQEDPTVATICDRLATLASNHVDLERVMCLASQAPAFDAAPLIWDDSHASMPKVRIGLAKDPAFHFYYEENLDLLNALGAELVEFSPLTDQHLPDGLDALYLGGGFPEVFARPLAENVSLRRAIHEAVTAGMPTYAECGGLMYLTEAIIDQRGGRHEMVGVLPGAIRMTDRLQHFGYVTVFPQRATILATVEQPIKGHEFHHSLWEHDIAPSQAAYVAVNRRGERRLEGFVQGNLVASYIHVHLLTNIHWAHRFIASAQCWKMDTVQGGKIGS